MQDTIKHIPIQVIVTWEDGQRFGKHIGVTPWFGHQDIDDYVTDYVADEWSNVAAEKIVKVQWIYV